MTGGKLCGTLIAVPGASDVIKGGIIAYQKDVKTGLLGVPGDVIETYGIVSQETAIKMAEQVRVLTASDLGISTTGNAGPTLQEGTQKEVYLGLSTKDQSLSRHVVFSDQSSRDDNILQTVREALRFIIETI